MVGDKTLQRLLAKKETPEPPDFLDDRIMAIIFKDVKKNSLNQRSLYLAWFFFFLGLVSGIIISTIFVKSDTILFGFNFSEHGLIIQIFCSFVILLLFERLYRLTIDMRNKYFDIEIE
jgi:polyferredoxin